MINVIKKKYEMRMEKIIKILKKKMSNIRAGRASPDILVGVLVEYYGVATPIHKLASIVVENSRTLKITVFDRSLNNAIEKAIIASDLGIHPFFRDSNIIITFPLLTEERRRDFVKIVRSEAEKIRVTIRNVRREANEKVKELLKYKQISADKERRSQENIQKMTDFFIKKVNILLTEKEKELIHF